MIYVEKKFKLKDKNFIEFKNESELFELFYQNDFDKEEYIRNNKVDNNTFVKAKGFENKFYLTLEEIDLIEDKVKDMGVISKLDFFRDYEKNYSTLDKLENKNEQISILKIYENNIKEELFLEPLKVNAYYTDIENTDFKGMEEVLNKSNFLKMFDSFAFAINDNGETFIALERGGNNILLDKEFIINMIEKYNENEIQYIPPTEPTNMELADDYKEYIQQQQSYELEF